jgi:protein-disulfide isomerase
MPALTRALRSALLLAAAAPLLACNTGEAAKDDELPAKSPGAAAAATDAARDSALLARADSARIAGSPDAPIWIIEISDFQCPYCRVWHDSTYPRIKREYVDAGKARLAYFNLPLPNHANAMPAAEAAMCAGLQGKFWEMHDAIFSTQDRWARLPDARPVFDSLAGSVGVEANPYLRCMNEHTLQPLIRADAARAQETGVQSTPTFIVGSFRLEGAYPYEDFRRAVDSALVLAGGARR